MKMQHVSFAVAALVGLFFNATAATHFVDLNSPSPAPPYASWVTAATNIQDAVDVATDGDLVLVTNGLYRAGGRGLTALTNRVLVTNAIILRSVNGPGVTAIEGYQVPGVINDFGAVRCVYLGAGATLMGFTITNGATIFGNNDGIYESYGGGVYCQNETCLVTNCLIVNCSAGDGGGGDHGGVVKNCVLNGNWTQLYGYSYGGGAGQATLINCGLSGNSSDVGGGVGLCALTNCTLTGNQAGAGGGASDSALNNCIIYFNTAVSGPNVVDWWGSSTLNFCCTTPLPASGANNISLDPQLADPLHISGISPCVLGGSAGFTSGTDIDDEAWNSPPSIGCDQYIASGATGPLTVTLSANFTNVATGITVDFAATIAGHATSNAWDFADGTKLQNQLAATHTWSAAGNYPVQVTAYNDTFPAGVTATVMVHVLVQPVQYVNAAGTNPVNPYLTWSTAATNIQDAVDVAYIGGTILVTNGVYQFGGCPVRGALTNRVALTKNTLLRSVNGPAVTTIQGNPVIGDGAVRCVYLTNGATITGFTLLNGGTRNTGDGLLEQSGGGVYCESTGIFVSNCVFNANSAVIGGGASQGTLLNCQFIGNSSVSSGGGAQSSVLKNCALSGNTAGSSGGGAESCTLIQCTLTGNSVGNVGGGANSCTLTNCILFNNTARSQRDYNSSGCVFSYCCTEPLPLSDTNSMSADPQLTDAAHVSSSSPCIGAGGLGVSSGTDIDGEAWAGTPSIGCDEFGLAAASGPLAVSIRTEFTNAAQGFPVPFRATVLGHATYSTWNFGDGITLSNKLAVSHAWTASSDYTVVLTAFNSSNPGGISATALVHIVAQPVHYVSLANPAPTAPFTSWATAATNIQDAVDAAMLPGALVLVSNGVYQAGGRPAGSALTNRLVLAKPVVVKSVNGPLVTTIVGKQPAGDNAIRCAYLTNHATLSGFTLTQGATQIFDDPFGGGVFCESTGETVSNCVITLNLAIYGAGASGGTLNNCVISSNQTTYFYYYGSGAGASGGTLNNCLLFDNQAVRSGGGAEGCTLNNCTVVNNLAVDHWGQGGTGWGANYCELNNSIVYYNGDDVENSVANYTCAGNVPPGLGNFNDIPSFLNWTNHDYHLQTNSPCINSGNNSSASGVDFDGNPRIVGAAVDFGAYEYQTVIPFTCTILAADTNVVIGFPLGFSASYLGGHPSTATWNFGNGALNGVQLPVTNVWLSAGDYPVRLTAFNPGNPGGISATVAVHVVTQSIHYVSQTGTNPVAPYQSWATAATNIQDAVDAAFVGGAVLVSNGIYSAGSKVVAGVTNRVATGRWIQLASVNGPASTVIRGQRVSQRVRCVHLSNGASLAGFTLTNGAALNSGDVWTQCSGGGLWCETASLLVSNCVFAANAVTNYGGGAYQGRIRNCTFTGNSADTGGAVYGGVLDGCSFSNNTATTGGAADSGALSDCAFTANQAVYGGAAHGCYVTNSVLSFNVATNAGGASDCTMYQCSLFNNTAASVGGGVQGGYLNYCNVSNNVAGDSGGGVFYGFYFVTLENCLVIGNKARLEGGGVYGGYVNNCTLISNTASNGGGVAYCGSANCTVAGNTATNGGGASGGWLNNSILYFNQGGNFTTNDYSLNYCCTAPLPANGAGNFTNAPLFVNLAAGNLRLQAGSPCINAGFNPYVPVTADLDGNPRIQGVTVDVGAYELQSPASLLSYAWAQRYGLATDGSADSTDADGDGASNWHEWRADTIPTNAASYLHMLAITNGGGGLNVSWQSVATRNYRLERATILSVSAPFQTIATDIPGVAGTNSFNDSETTGNGPYFYRIGVQ